MAQCSATRRSVARDTVAATPPVPREKRGTSGVALEPLRTEPACMTFCGVGTPGLWPAFKGHAPLQLLTDERTSEDEAMTSSIREHNSINEEND